MSDLKTVVIRKEGQLFQLSRESDTALELKEGDPYHETVKLKFIWKTKMYSLKRLFDKLKPN